MKMKTNYLLCALLGASITVLGMGCSTLDRLYTKQVTMTTKPVVQVMTNTVFETNLIARVIEHTNIVYVTNETSGVISGYMTRVPVATNMVLSIQTNYIPLFFTNFIQVATTNFVDRPEVEATISATGSVVNAFLPGIGSILTLVLGSLYHGYRQVRNNKVNEALIQGVETARAVLATSPQGQEADAQLVRWLMTHQKEAGVFATISTLVDNLSDNPAARLTAQEILARMQQAEQARAAATVGS